MQSRDHAMKTMTIRNIPRDLAEALDAERKRRGISLNGTAVALMREALGMTQDEHRDNGLGRFAGSWSEEQFREFEATQAPFNEIDEGIWS